MLYLHVLLVLGIDGADDLNHDIFALKVSPLVYIDVSAARNGYLVRPFNLSRVQLAFGWKLFG